MTYQIIVLVPLVCAIFFLGAIAIEVLALRRRQKDGDQFQKVEFLLSGGSDGPIRFFSCRCLEPVSGCTPCMSRRPVVWLPC